MTVYWARRGGKTHFMQAVRAGAMAAIECDPAHARAVFMQTAREHGVAEALPKGNWELLEQVWNYVYLPWYRHHRCRRP